MFQHCFGYDRTIKSSFVHSMVLRVFFSSLSHLFFWFWFLVIFSTSHLLFDRQCGTMSATISIYWWFYGIVYNNISNMSVHKSIYSYKCNNLFLSHFEIENWFQSKWNWFRPQSKKQQQNWMKIRKKKQKLKQRNIPYTILRNEKKYVYFIEDESNYGL